MSGCDDVDLRNFGQKEKGCFCAERYREADHDSYDDRRCSQERSIWYGRMVQPSFFLPNTSVCVTIFVELRNQGMNTVRGLWNYRGMRLLSARRWYARIVWKYNGFAEQYRRSHRRIVPAWCSSGKWRDDPVPSDNCEMWWKTHAHQRGGQRGRWQVVCHERWKTMVFHGGKIPGAWKSDATRYYRQRVWKVSHQIRGIS